MSSLPLDRELLRMQIDTLFTHDPNGRMVSVNEPGGKDAPRFFLGKTTGGNEWRFRHDVDDQLRGELELLCAAEPGDGADAPRDSTRFEEVLSRFAPVQRIWAGPAYWFPSELPAASGAVRITKENRDLLRPHLEEWLGDVGFRDLMFAIVVGGRAVSICCSVRASSVAHEVGVETAPEFRGRGFAKQVVGTWATAVRKLCRIPLYSTSWDNTASQALARSLRLRSYGSDLHIT
jgi:ribosomal protein S18 acetylase RimI-like enzyme